ncbi:unnamed protein product [Didymodactylos carnosus]|uniref:Uncharacterized protein n=1 Tax=Didymodactylos carnosus TaxID=1234261 RepID=A0A815E3P1_9BILA|nr:unnamed protein product [Didymodactylos carnosus]CAF1301684.1 unnamed protein product [Didymodactylos carnosus]CAF3899901.1 unnamed protein product [Didymodactylos carnosus]CAF4127120.1 unnamed protein product [Didymodactylos carnosus]
MGTTPVVKYPATFICPITHDVMEDPVMDPDGNSYERGAIINWLSRESTSPITKKSLTVADLVPNQALAAAIEQFKITNNISRRTRQVAAASSTEPMDVDLNVQVSYSDGYSHISVQPPVGTRRSPCDICCVVDTSGSMQVEVETKNEKNDVEKFGLSQLDLVKHALKTIILILDKDDRLALVSFSSKATVRFQLLKMDQTGKQKALVAVERLAIETSTNLWDGLKTGLDVLRKDSSDKTNSALFLLTDGLTDCEPPNGHISALKRYIKQTPFSCIVNCFGFGYSLDSQLLEKIAVFGNDGGLVGTVFVNALSTLLTTVATNVSLVVKLPQNSTVLETEYTELYETQNMGDDGLKFNLGSIMYGQSKDLIIPLPTLESHSPSFNVSLHYTSPYKKAFISTNTTLVEKKDKLARDILIHRYRLEFVSKVKKAMNLMKFKSMSEALELIRTFEGQVKSSPVKDEPFIVDLMKDLTGQVTEAISKAEWFERWGKHYLPSITRAHLLQICNNFKDPGVQHYGGELFNRVRDEVADIFETLPMPKPSVAIRTEKPITMNTYYNAAGGCIWGECMVTMSDGRLKSVKNIRRDDIVWGGAKVVCVVKSVCKNSQAEMIQFENGLVISPWHPIRLNGNYWHFPHEIDCAACSIQVEAEEVYNFVLDSQHTMMVNRIECVTLGHGFKGEVIEHVYYGTADVIKDLQALDGWKSGCVVVKPHQLIRDKKQDL